MSCLESTLPHPYRVATGAQSTISTRPRPEQMPEIWAAFSETAAGVGCAIMNATQAALSPPRRDAPASTGLRQRPRKRYQEALASFLSLAAPAITSVAAVARKTALSRSGQVDEAGGHIACRIGPSLQSWPAAHQMIDLSERRYTSRCTHSDSNGLAEAGRADRGFEPKRCKI